MYLRGLSIRQIATWCRVEYEKVRLHIRSHERLDPSIFGRRLIIHDRPKPASRPLTEPLRTPWDVRFAQLQQFTTEHRRLPQQLSTDRVERQLHRWLARQRENYTHGRMEKGQAEQLDSLGQWRGRVLGDRDAHWRNIHGQLVRFIEANGRMPQRSNDGGDPQEATLDIWVQTQRAKARAGKLTRERRAVLDATVPRWDQTRRSSPS